MFSQIRRFIRSLFFRPAKDRAAPTDEVARPPASVPGEGDIPQEIAERIMDDEALTADLVDAAARRLLEWSIAQARGILRETTPLSEEREARLEALYRRMREIARQVGQMLPEEQEAVLEKLLNLPPQD